MLRILPIPAAAVIVFLTGLLHGLLTDRWSQSGELEQAVARLEQVPSIIGDWQGSALAELDPQQVAQAELSGYVSRRYENRLTQETFSLLLVCGRPGPLASHTPDICYPGAGYAKLGEPVRYRGPDDTVCPAAELWVSTFHKQTTGGSLHLRVCWSFTADGTWKAPSDARFSFPGRRALYKLYLVRELSRTDERLADDPCVQFLPQLLPALNRALFPTPAP